MRLKTVPQRHWFALSLCIAGLVALGNSARAQPQLDAEILKKTKAATVHLEVKLTDGKVFEGSGFCTEEPGVIITNAHVLGMMDADSRKPSQVEVTIAGGTPASRIVKGKVLGVDRGTDLALIRIEGKDLPAPLKLGSSFNLTETENVFVFGYPYGKELGKAVTVSKSSVSSLRKSSGGQIEKVQLEGGLNPGNSGGPVVDAQGNVIGVSVSGIRASAIGFAIPAEDVVRFFNGRMITSHYETPYREGDKIILPMRLEMVDPLNRIKKVAVEIWTGLAGPNRASGSKQPAPVMGDSEILVIDFKYGKSPSVSMDVALPVLPDPKQVYYYRPVITNGLDQTRWVAGIPLRLRPPVDRVPVELKYAPPAQRTAEMTSKGSFRIRDSEGQEHVLDVDFRTVFTETFREKEARFIPMRATYNQFFLNIKNDGKPHSSMDEFLKILKDVRFMAAEIEMDLDGGMGRAKEDIVKVPKTSQRFLSDMSDQVLQSMEVMTVPLPSKKLQPREEWKAQRNFMIGNAFFVVPASVDITYKFIGVQKDKGRYVALIGVEGDVRARRGAGGPDVTGTFRSLAYVSLETGEVLQSNGTVKAELDIAINKRPAKAIAVMSVGITRPAPVKTDVVKTDPKTVPKTEPMVDAGATKILGGPAPEYREVGPEGSLLVGLEIGLAKFGKNDVVRAFRPIFRQGDKETLGKQRGTNLTRVVKVVAKEGYAVGAVTIKAGLTVDGMSVTFMKVVNGQLDPKDAYESDWIGGMGGRAAEKLGGDGVPVIGIAGKANAQDATGLGLILQKK